MTLNVKPGLAHNIKQTIEQTDKVIRGVKYCMEITKADKAIFAIKKKNREAVLALLDALKDEENISVHLLPDIYPMVEERAVDSMNVLALTLTQHSFRQQQDQL